MVTSDVRKKPVNVRNILKYIWLNKDRSMQTYVHTASCDKSTDSVNLRMTAVEVTVLRTGQRQLD